MELLLLLTNGLLMLMAFYMGVKVGRNQSDSKPTFSVPEIKLPSIKEHVAKKQEMADKAYMDAILENIENYDGTESSQKELPERRYL